jgi:hypothetical protein
MEAGSSRCLGVYRAIIRYVFAGIIAEDTIRAVAANFCRESARTNRGAAAGVF